MARRILPATILFLAACVPTAITIDDHTSVVVIPHVIPKPRFAAKSPFDGFLDKIAFLESSNGQNTDHKPLKYGIHAGTAAVGSYGLMPDTARFVAEKSKNPFLAALSGLPLPEVGIILSKDEELAREVAREYAHRLYRQFKGDSTLMAYAWYNGPNAMPSLENILNHYYVQRYINR